MESRVGIATIRRIENTDKDARGHVSTYARIQTALEAAGVLFHQTMTEQQASASV